MSDADRLAEIQARIPSVYDGPWTYRWQDGDGDTPDCWVISYPTEHPLAGLVAEVADYGAELAEFISHSREDVPFLLNLARQQQAEIAELQAKLRIRERQLEDMDAGVIA